MSFYHQMTDDLETADHGPGWEKDVYPLPESVQEALIDRTLFVGERDHKIIAAMILNHDYTEGYERGDWQTKAAPHDILFVHALGVDFNHQGEGLAKRLIDYTIDHAQELQLKAIQLDVLWNNDTAKELYLSKGFNYVGRIQLYYEDTGMTDYDLYEYII